MTPETIQTIAICVAVAIVAFLGFRAFQNTASKVADVPKELIKTGGDAVRQNIEAIGTEIRDLFGATPQITVNRTVIQQAPTTVRELYFAKQHSETREQLISKKFGSAKTLIVSQKFVIKAGFDLNRLCLDFDDRKGELRATIADALLVNVEHEGPFQIEKSESGWWNRITDEERHHLINSLPVKARAEIEVAVLRQLAVAELERVLNRLCHGHGLKLRIMCQASDPHVRDAKPLSEPSPFAIEKLGLFESGPPLGPST